MNEQPTTIKEVEAIAAKYGISLTSEDYEAAQQVMDQRRQHLEQSTVEKSGRAAWVDRFNTWYPRFLNALIGVGDVLITMTQTTLIAFGVPLVLLMLLVVEQQRTFHGVKLFEIHDALASFSAIALVLLNLTLELLISWVEHRAKWIEPAKHEFSFRLMARRAAYMLGKTTDWQPRAKSPADRYRSVLRIVTIAILLLALAGSMTTIISRTSGNWLQAIRVVLVESSLLDMTTWLGGLLFAFAAVLSAQALSRYVAEKVVEVVAIMQSNADDKPRLIADAIGATGAAFLMARIKDKQRQRRIGAASMAADMPDLVPHGTVRVSSVPKQPETTYSPKLQQALDWLDKNDGTRSTKTTVRHAAHMADVSVTTMQRAMNIWKARHG